MSQITASNPLTFAKTDEVIAYLKTSFGPSMPPAQLDAVIKELKLPSADQKIPATGSVAGALFWCSFSLESQGRHFNHNAWGGATLGGGGCWGDLYTDDLAKCFRDTKSFSLTVTPVSVLTTFHAGDNSLLATYVGGGYMAPAFSFVGGGSGSWS